MDLQKATVVQLCNTKLNDIISVNNKYKNE